VIAARLLYSGEKYGLDYSIYQPDGICYTKLAADFAHYDSSLLNSQLASKYAWINSGDIESLNCDSVKARVLYPLLSAPFLKIFGVSGMLVIPILSYLFMLLLIIISLEKLNLGFFAKSIVLASVLMSSTYSRWYVANIVDPLLITLCTFLVYLLVQQREIQSATGVTCIFLVISAMALTKRSLHLTLICCFILLTSSFLQRRSNHLKEYRLRIVSLFFVLPAVLDASIGKILGRQNGLKSIIDTQKCLQGQTASVCKNSFRAINTDSSTLGMLPSAETSNSISSINGAIPSKQTLLFDSLLNVIQTSIRYLFVSLAQVFVVDLPLACMIILWAFSIPYLWRNLNLLNLFSIFSPVLISLVASLNGALGLNYRFEMAFFYPVIISQAIWLEYLFRKTRAMD
jgi:hypothetical protein